MTSTPDSLRGEANDDMPSAGAFQSEIRRALGLSQQQLAQIMNASMSTVSLSEAGKRHFSPEMELSFMQATGIPPWLLSFLYYLEAKQSGDWKIGQISNGSEVDPSQWQEVIQLLEEIDQWVIGRLQTVRQNLIAIIAQNPRNQTIRQQRKSLLQHVGLLKDGTLQTNTAHKPT
ncbi:MAG: helix-turn-helix transcriptional regulator [Candidatus Peribacteraceae bacterium]|nr:helix-turn-helix transcriptional regulator [Candidatus Peribacteraceae bacterium]